MFGTIFGILCTVAFFKVAFGRRRRWGHHHRSGRHRHGHHRGWFVRQMLYRLNTGPGQEKVVLGEMEAMRATTRELRGELKEMRAQLGTILRDELFDQTKVDALYRKQDELIAKLRTAATGSFERIHGVLDAKQKADLASMIEGGFRYGYGC